MFVSLVIPAGEPLINREGQLTPPFIDSVFPHFTVLRAVKLYFGRMNQIWGFNNQNTILFYFIFNKEFFN